MNHREPAYIIPPQLKERVKDLYAREGGPSATAFLHSHGIPIRPVNLRNRMNREGIFTENVGPKGQRQRKWTEAEVDELRDLYSDPTVPMAFLVERLKRPYNSIKNKLQSLGIHRGLPESRQPAFQLPVIETKKPLLVIADLHVPFQDAEWIDRCVELAVAWGAEEVLLAGDAFDAQYLSRFERFDNPTFQEEVEEWGRVETQLLKPFKKIWWSLGNHEARAAKAFNFNLPLQQMVQRQFVVDQQRVSVLDSYAVHVNPTSPCGGWRVEHPKAAGSSVALDLVAHHLCNVAVAHTHHSSQARDPSGRYFGVRIGAGCDHSRMRYCQRITHGKYAMTSGALILVPAPDRTRHWLLEPEMDLEAMARMYGPRYRGNRLKLVEKEAA